jgi:hypothetical protein
VLAGTDEAAEEVTTSPSSKSSAGLAASPPPPNAVERTLAAVFDSPDFFTLFITSSAFLNVINFDNT